MSGYRDPPLHSRFSSEPGQGNRKGRRPKGTRNLKTDLFEILGERVAGQVDGKAKRISKQRALLLSLVHSGIKGNTNAAIKVLEKVLKLEGLDDGPPDTEALSAEDAAILDAFIKQSGAGDGSE